MAQALPGRIHLEGPLGVGGFAKVYKGSLSGYPGDVAIKVVSTWNSYKASDDRLAILNNLLIH